MTRTALVVLLVAFVALTLAAAAFLVNRFGWLIALVASAGAAFILFVVLQVTAILSREEPK